MLLVSYWVVIFSVPFLFHSSMAHPDSREKGEAPEQEKVGRRTFPLHSTLRHAKHVPVLCWSLHKVPRVFIPPGDFCTVTSPGYKLDHTSGE